MALFAKKTKYNFCVIVNEHGDSVHREDESLAYHPEFCKLSDYPAYNAAQPRVKSANVQEKMSKQPEKSY